MSKGSHFFAKVIGLFAFFVFEMLFAGYLLHEQADSNTVRAVLDMPVVGDWYYHFRTRDLQEAVNSGDVSAMMTLHKDAAMHEKTDVASNALNQIRMSGSPTARLYAYEYDVRHTANGKEAVLMSDREMMLLHALVMKENLRPDYRDSTGGLFIQQSQRNALALSSILEKARNGDSDAQWLVGEMNNR